MPKPKAMFRSPPPTLLRIATEPTRTRIIVPRNSAMYFCQLMFTGDCTSARETPVPQMIRREKDGAACEATEGADPDRLADVPRARRPRPRRVRRAAGG